MIDESQYGLQPGDIHLPPAPYKLATKLQNGRGVYSFCMCPGGYVVNASSEAGRLVVNGMSYSGRNSANANSAIVVSVGEREFDKRDPLSGVRYQRGLEERAFALCGGKIPQQLLRRFPKRTRLHRLRGICVHGKGRRGLCSASGTVVGRMQ